ncbi:exocyst complex component 3-like isoform X2 [Alosa pseudoharengus]|uniref:exocyst complex component 3-like isoform X2 n=1 Tax=Alosa pseudoharengus TaxID=34774 RepID=UPI003F891C29
MSLRKKKAKSEGGEEKKEKKRIEGGEERKEKKRRSLGSFLSLRRKSSAPSEASFLLRTLSSRTSHDPVLPPAGEQAQLCMEPGGAEGSEVESDPEELGRTVMEKLEQVLMNGTSGSPEQNPGSLLEAWGQKNPVPAPGQGSRAGRYPQPWLHQFHQRVQQSVELHFPCLPAEVSAMQQPPQPSAYLRQVQEVVQGELLRLAPVLQEAGLLGTVIDRYHTHTVGQLERLLQKNLNTDQTFTLLEWTLHTYLSGDLLGHRDLHSDVTNHIDFLLYTECVQRTCDLLLKTSAGEMEVCLQHILSVGGYEETQRSPVEEATQCVGFVRRAQELSPTLEPRLRSLLSAQLRECVQRYVAMEKKHLGQTGLKYLFSTCNTCAELRLLAVQLASEVQTDAASPAAVKLLKELEAQATKQLLHTATHNTEAPLKTYFKAAGEGDLGELQTTIGQLFTHLPLVNDKDTHRELVYSVYQRITTSYLRHLLLSNRSQLEGRWGDFAEKVRRDAEELHTTFTQQDGEVQRCVLLQRVSEVLKTSGVDTLKLILTEIITECPHISKEQLSALLKWKGRLSKQEMTEVMDAVSECSPQMASPVSARSEPPLKAPSPSPTSPLWYRALPCLRQPITA